MIRQSPVVESAYADPSWYLIEEVNHRVVNEYGRAIALLALAARQCASGIAREALGAAEQRLRAYAATHRALLPPLGTGTVSLCDYVGRYCEATLKSSLADTGATITLRADEVDLPAEQCWRVGLIVAELVSNAFRHGLGGGAGSIMIAMNQCSGWLHCEVSDNGRGAAEPAIGRGRRLIGSITHELAGTVDWTFSPQGSCARLRVPLPA